MSRQPTHRPRTEKPAGSRKHEGQGGSRHGYRASNEIEDMEIFDDEHGKQPSADGRHDANSIDENGYRKRK